MKKIVWITTGAFIDTDFYIIKNIRNHYRIDLYILKKSNEIIDFMSEIDSFQSDSFKCEVIKLGKRYRDITNVICYIKLFKTIKKNGYDVVYSTLSNPPYFIPLLKSHVDSKRVILAIHNVHVPKGATKYFFNKLYNLFSIKSFDNFQTFSINQSVLLKGIAPNKNVNYAPFYLKDYGRIKSKSDHSLITFLSFGNIRHYKRIDVLIVAAQRAYKLTNIKFRVIIAGECSDWNVYKKLIKISELFDTRIGRVDTEEIPRLFAESDYFVAPYQDIAQSGSVMVAVNYEKPVIASRLPAFAEVITDGKNGFLIDPASCEELTEVFTNILNNHSNIIDELVENQVRNKTENYSNDIITKKYLDFIDRIGALNAKSSK